MGQYMKDVRKRVGHRPLVVSVAGCLVINQRNEILLQHRKDNHLWSIPGGAVEPGETVEETVKREVFEETSLTVKGLRFFQVFSGENQHYKYPNGDEVYFVNLIFECRDFEGTAKVNDDESTEMKFFAADSLPPLTPSNEPIMESYFGK